jgi:Rv2525c-like, glycoside hydrolase-like domain
MQFGVVGGESIGECDGWCCMRLMRPVAAVLILLGTVAAPAVARTVEFHGGSVEVAGDWPVYRLAAHPHMCVRMDRRAVYLGTPSPNQRCPAGAIGRRRAIVVDPGATERSGARASTAPAATVSAADFTGLGFDACSAPSSRTMVAWAASPYRAIGVYVGGANRACSQPNLTSTWVGEQIAAGWHLIPTYVGLQAPTSSCSSCAKLSTTLPTQQGTVSAEDAVAKAQSVGIGPGSPIYFDMEAYTRTSSASNATLTFLAAWTARLHALGYASGVYSSSASGIADLASPTGASYPPLPDDLWIANWNGREDTLDFYVPATAWARHQRIHQYRGGHEETYGRVTIDVDSDYVEGATAGATAARPALPPLTVAHVEPEAGTVKLWIRCGWPGGETCPGQIVLRAHVLVPVRARGRAPVKTKLVRLAVGHRAFNLAGERSHVFRIGLNSRGAPLLRERGTLKAQLLVAIPGSRATRAVRLRQAR